MAAPSEYTFTQPVGGKTVAWRPLKTGQELQILATYRDQANQHLRPYARMAARIVSIDGVPRSFGPMDFQEWEDLDTDAFLEHITAEETKRQAAYSKKPAGDLVADFEAGVQRVLASITELSSSVTALRSLVQQSAGGPLGGTTTPR